MDYDNFDPMSPRESDYLSDLLDEEKVLKARRSRRTRQSGAGESHGWRLPHMPKLSVGLSLGQLGVIVLINALVSLAISLAVVLLVGGHMATVPLLPEDADAVAASTSAISATVEMPDVTSTESPASTPALPAEQLELPPTATYTPAVSVPASYIVQPGDTLISISEQFDVDLGDLMRANGLDNPDYLLLGQQLVIPRASQSDNVAEEPVPVSTPVADEEPPEPMPAGPSPTPVPTPTSVPASEIRLTMDVLNPDDVARETVYIANNGLYVKLTGWTLTDEQGNTYTFPDYGLGGGGAAVNLHTAAGADTITDLFWNRPMAVWEIGEEVTLRDAIGTKILSVEVRSSSVEP